MADLNQWRRLVASENGPESPTTRLLLLALSLYMDPSGGSCFPSTRTLASDTALSRRAVMEHVKIAESLGWLKIRSAGINGKGWKRSLYEARIPFDVVNVDNHLDAKRGDSELPPQAERGHPDSQGGHPDTPNVVTEGDLNYPYELSNELANKEFSFLLEDGSTFFVDDEFLGVLKASYPGVDIETSLREVEAWCFSNPRRRKKRDGAKRFVNSWMKGEAKNNGNPERKNQIDSTTGAGPRPGKAGKGGKYDSIATIYVENT